ncbi:MAG: nitrile hydratase accessory protein [Burkholderiaceae bacterium]|nr:nitrile hydratase accessory protein [Burkholderiaceae bacterium]
MIDLAACPGLPIGEGAASGDDAGPVFAEPWMAQAFAMTLQLHQRGLFSWPEWAEALSAQIHQAQRGGDADLGDTYYHHWLAALEALVAAKGAARADELARCARAWDHAADRTPHGQPIVLQASDYGD